MNFERGKDVKEALHVGIRDAKHVNSIFISVRDPNIVDNRPYGEKRLTPNPQTIWKLRIHGNDVHIILNLLKNHMKFPWEYFFDKYPDLKYYIKGEGFQFMFHILLRKEDRDSIGFPIISLREIVGKHLIYENKVYFMKKVRP